MSDWIHGETGGYLRYSTERRNWFETDFPKFKAEAAKPLSAHKRTSEHASHIIEALETGRVYRGHFNVRNNGIIRNLPADAIIESPGFVDRFGINMVEGITLPTACAATCSVSVSVQRMSVEAAMSGDIDMLKLAVLHDPLVGAICTPDEVWQMVDEMVVAQAQWLPQYAAAVPAAKARLANATVQDAGVGRRGATRRALGRGVARDEGGASLRTWVPGDFAEGRSRATSPHPDPLPKGERGKKCQWHGGGVPSPPWGEGQGEGESEVPAPYAISRTVCRNSSCVSAWAAAARYSRTRDS